jgi:hypothetical protein
MVDMSVTRLQDVLSNMIGPTPWYWQTFPAITSVARQRFDWSHQGEQGPVGYVVTLGLEQEPDKPRLALNSYRPFLSRPTLGNLVPGETCSAACLLRSRRAQGLDIGQPAGWFKQSVTAFTPARLRSRSSRCRPASPPARTKSSTGRIVSALKGDRSDQLQGDVKRRSGICVVHLLPPCRTG